MTGSPGLNPDGTAINRFSDLIAEIPKGPFYDSPGIRIPYKGTEPYDVVIQTTQALRTFGVFVNEGFRGSVRTDSDGVARFPVVLDHGRNDITLEDDVTGQRIRTYLDAKHIHTALASLAESLEDVDINIQDTYNDRCLITSERNQIGDIWGARLLTPNTPAYQHEAYREILQEIHQGYRQLGGRRKALDTNIGAFTTVTPLVFRISDLGWRLGTSFLPNGAFQDRNRTQLTRASAIPGVTSVDSVGTANQLGAGTITYAWPAQTMTWTTPGGAAGAPVFVSAGGQFVLPGVSIGARFDGRINGPFAIAGGTNDALRLNIDGRGTIDITLTAGGARTGAQVAADINGALAADIRYGAPYNAVASVLTTTRVRLESPNVGSAFSGDRSSVTLENVANDAYFTVFGYPWVRSTSPAGELVGATALNLVSSDAFPDASPTLGAFDILFARNTAREESISVTGNNRVTDVLTGAVPGLTLVKNAGDTVEMLGAFPYQEIGSDNNEQGITITIDPALLPGAGDTETVTLFGSNFPDGWLADNAVGDLLPHGWFDFQQLTLENDGTGDTTLECSATARAFQFLEWPFTFTLWVRNRHTAAINVRLGVNYGAGWVEGGLAAVPSMNADGGDAMTQISLALVPPATATDFRVRIRHDAAAVGETIEVAQASLVADNVSAAFLGTNTVPRSEHRIFFGEIAYIWSPDDLSAAENILIGLNAPNPPGHIDYSVPVHVPVDRFDISEYLAGVGLDIRGAFDEADLFSGTLTNLSLVVRTPARRSHLVPSRVSLVEGEALAFPDPPAAPYTATLAVASNMDQTESVLYEDGIPVPNSRWQFNSATQVEVTSGYNAGAEYTLDYQALIQWTSPVVDLGATFADYTFFVDLCTWARMEPEVIEIERTVQLQVNPQTRRAVLPDFSNGQKTDMSLQENDGLTVRIIPASKYRLLDDDRTVQIDSDTFKPAAVYFLTFTALRPLPAQVPEITLEVRQSVDAIAWTAWAEYEKDQVLPRGYRYAMFRVTASGILDVRDFRLISASAKGLNLFGAGGTVMILRP